MKLREFCDKTGISKRNVHFYIKEGLLTPLRDPVNGYYEFSDEDVRRLILIRQLRNAGFSLSQILSLIEKPSTSVYYMNLRLRELKAQISRAEKMTDAISYIQHRLPLHPTLDRLAALVEEAGIPVQADVLTYDGQDFEDSDNDLVNRYLWEGFLPEAPLSDYQEFLWSKINRFSAGSYAEDYRRLSRTLHRLTDDQIRMYFADNHKLHSELISLEESGYPAYVKKMKASIRRLLENKPAVRRWLDNYHTLTAPAARLYDSEIAGTMDELSPAFLAYRTHVHAVCQEVFDWLHSEEGRPLLDLMDRTLGDHYDIDHCSHGELQAMMAYGDL